MAVRDYLYERFENFDKPTEDDFRVFIDFAGIPTTFSNRTITPTTDILTDLNNEEFSVDVRESFIISYGPEIYILFGLEGNYGQAGLNISEENVAFIGNTSSGALTKTLTANTSISNAGIKAGDVFPQGTSFEDLWIALLTVTSISNLRYEANISTGFIEIGGDLIITRFLWTITGVPTGLHLRDSDNQYDEDVSGSGININETYNYPSYKKLTWSLTGTGVNTLTTTAYWVEPTYYGTNLTGLIPTASEILGGIKHLSLTESGVTININTVITEYGWIAVENTQTNKIYTTWRVTEFNTSGISPSSFIKYIGNVLVGTKVYNIYIFNYPTQVNTITLY